MPLPRIGVSRGLSRSRPDGGIPSVYQQYHDRIREAGGEPVDLYPGLSAPERLLDDLGGVVICGGPDINPDRYGQDRHPETAGIDDARDALELGLLREAMARDLPAFAICRGHQALNVARGGPLLQHIEGDGHRAYGDGLSDSRFHDITLAPGSRLARLLGATSMRVNSRHHQAVTAEGVAPGLIPVAWSPDGLVEGLESPEHRWVVGVQWHPERDEVRAPFWPLFEDFVRACASGAREQSPRIARPAVPRT